MFIKKQVTKTWFMLLTKEEHMTRVQVNKTWFMLPTKKENMIRVAYVNLINKETSTSGLITWLHSVKKCSIASMLYGNCISKVALTKYIGTCLESLSTLTEKKLYHQTTGRWFPYKKGVITSPNEQYKSSQIKKSQFYMYQILTLLRILNLARN